MKWIRAIVFLLLVASAYAALDGVFMHKDASYYSLRRFFSERGDKYDVLAFGPSYMFCMLSPVELYRKFGIRSFVPGSSIQHVEATVSYVAESLRRYSPRVVLLEPSMVFFSESPVEYPEGYAHAATDPFPFGLEKLSLVDRINVSDDLMNYAVPFVKYHSRWKQLAKADFKLKDERPKTCFNGFRLYVTHESHKLPPIPKGVRPEPPHPRLLSAFERIQKEVSDRGCRLVLVFSPRNGYVGRRFCRYLWLKDYAARQGIPCIDLFSDFAKTGIDSATDFRDGGHLNVKGARKATQWIGRQLLEKIGPVSALPEAERSWWESEGRRLDDEISKEFSLKERRKPAKGQ